MQLGNVKGDAAVFADQEKTRFASGAALRALNDNDFADIQPTLPELFYLRRALGQPGGKLPLFDRWGQRVNEQTVRACISHGWAEPWFTNPLKPDWLVCRLTEHGRELVTPH